MPAVSASRSLVARAVVVLASAFALLVACESRVQVLAPEPQQAASTGTAAGVTTDVVLDATVIEFVSATSQQSGGNSLSFPRPAGVLPGDVLIAQVVTHGGAHVTAPPADWTLVRGDRHAEHASSFVYWKRAGAAEPGSYTWALSASTRSAGGIAAYRRVGGGITPVDVHAGLHTATDTRIVAPSVTTTAGGTLLVALFGAASEPRETTLSFAPPPGMTEHYDLSSQMKGNQRNAVAMQASAAFAGPGATGVRAATLSAARPGWGQLLALVPDAGTPVTPPPNRAPVADAGGPYTGAEGRAVAFDGSASADPDGDELTFAWTFGDGGTATGPRPSHTYRDNGTFNVVLTVTDPHGASHASATTATITNVPPTATLGLSASTAMVGTTVTATASFADPGVGDGPWTWELDWGDGTRTAGSAAEPTTPIGAQHAWAAAATYTVRFTVTDKDGGAGSAQQVVMITAAAPGEQTWYTDFSEHAAGVAPAGWSQPYASSPWQVVELEGATGGKALQNTVTGYDVYALRWDAVGSPADVELETVVRVVSGRNGSLGLYARGAAGKTFYSVRLDEGKNQWIIARYNSGSSQYFAAWNNPFPVGTWVRQRFRVQGNTLQARIWAANVDEPAGWTMQATDPSPLPPGHAGVWLRYGTTTNQYDWVRATLVGGESPPPPPPGVSAEWVWSGAQGADGATVRTRLSGPTADVRLRVSTDSLFRSYTETTSVSTGGNNVATFNIRGLAARTRHYYRPLVEGAEFASMQGAFNTLPAVGSAHSFTFALGACQRTETSNLVFDHIRQRGPLFWLQTGDIHYRNIATNNVDLFRHAYNMLHAHAPQAALFRSTALVHVWDDHDGAGGNDTDGTKPGWPAVKEAYRENVPHHPLVEGAGGAIYHSFVVGRVRFIVSDLRSERSPKAQLDDDRKTMMGAAQKAHFRAELAAAKANGQFIAWVTSVPWIADPLAGADHWGGYDTERREIAAMIDELGVAGQMFALAGDMHATAIDTGINNQWGGFPIFHAAPTDQAGSTKGGPYTHGPFLPSSTSGQFGVVAVMDQGGPSIQVSFTGWRHGGTISGASHQFTLTLN
jgi:phosphodiesterase/alkaline phosphatase D-like protein